MRILKILLILWVLVTGVQLYGVAFTSPPPRTVTVTAPNPGLEARVKKSGGPGVAAEDLGSERRYNLNA